MSLVTMSYIVVSAAVRTISMRAVLVLKVVMLRRPPRGIPMSIVFVISRHIEVSVGMAVGMGVGMGPSLCAVGAPSG